MFREVYHLIETIKYMAVAYNDAHGFTAVLAARFLF
jgi:hypothetical protein